MLKRLLVKNFTVFAEADFEFGPGLNVVVGTNGTGKSHVLKLGYSVLNVWVSRLQQVSAELETKAPEATTWDKGYDLVPPLYFGKIRNVFRPVPDKLSELVRRGVDPLRGEIKFEFSNDASQAQDISIDLNSNGESSLINLNLVKVQELLEELALPIFIPAKEVLTLGLLLPASEQLRFPLEENYVDLLKQLSRLPLQHPALVPVLTQLIRDIGGEIETEGSRFYLSIGEEKPMAIGLVAEGLRKFGTLQRLLSNGSLTPQATLFWDEPEANLNPALLKKLAVVLTDLASQGFQIILATHSLFLLKELHVLAQQQKSKVRYFGLYSSPAGDTRVEQTDDLETLNHLAALDEELAQTARFQRVLDEDFFQPESQLPE